MGGCDSDIMGSDVTMDIAESV